MDNRYYFGIALLLTILATRWAVNRWQMHRLGKWWQKGQTAMETGNLIAAEAAFRTCVKLAPLAGPARRVLGSVLIRRGKLREAEEHLRFGAEVEPRNPVGHMDLGFFFALCVPDRAEAAIDAFAKAVECSPNVREALLNEARLAPLRTHDRFRRLLESKE
jgi:tetratricopeptide (TPR) repeat protein